MNTRFPSVLSLHPWLQPSLSSVLFILSLACASPGLAACGGASGADRVRVEYVYDGDTVRLDDGRKLRLIGVNTPEASSSSRAGEPYSRRARAFLAARIEEAGNRLHILPDQQKQDRYKRDLVHLFLPDGRNLSELLLRAGLGFFVVVPPNTLFADCYRDAEQSARAARKGIWDGQFRRISADSSERGGGFALLEDRLLAVKSSRRWVWLTLDSGVLLRVSRQDRHYFPDWDWRGKIGRSLRVRGWLSNYDGKLQMRLRHPLMVEWQ